MNSHATVLSCLCPCMCRNYVKGAVVAILQNRGSHTFQPKTPKITVPETRDIYPPWRWHIKHTIRLLAYLTLLSPGLSPLWEQLLYIAVEKKMFGISHCELLSFLNKLCIYREFQCSPSSCRNFNVQVSLRTKSLLDICISSLFRVPRVCCVCLRVSNVKFHGLSENSLTFPSKKYI